MLRTFYPLLIYQKNKNKRLPIVQIAYVAISFITELSWEQTLKIIKGVVAAIDYMHTFPGHVVHGDIKPGNILLAAVFKKKKKKSFVKF